MTFTIYYTKLKHHAQFVSLMNIPSALRVKPPGLVPAGQQNVDLFIRMRIVIIMDLADKRISKVSRSEQASKK